MDRRTTLTEPVSLEVLSLELKNETGIELFTVLESFRTIVLSSNDPCRMDFKKCMQAEMRDLFENNVFIA